MIHIDTTGLTLVTRFDGFIVDLAGGSCTVLGTKGVGTGSNLINSRALGS